MSRHLSWATFTSTGSDLYQWNPQTLNTSFCKTLTQRTECRPPVITKPENRSQIITKPISPCQSDQTARRTKPLVKGTQTKATFKKGCFLSTARLELYLGLGQFFHCCFQLFYRYLSLSIFQKWIIGNIYNISPGARLALPPYPLDRKQTSFKGWRPRVSKLAKAKQKSA